MTDAGTVRFNLDPFGELSEHDIWKALKNAHLESAVSSLDDPITEGGECACTAASRHHGTPIIFIALNAGYCGVFS